MSKRVQPGWGIWELEGGAAEKLVHTWPMVSQWSNTHCGNACPDVAARSVPVKPKDSTTGRYAFRLKMGVPGRCASSNTCPALLVEHAVDAAQRLCKAEAAASGSARQATSASTPLGNILDWLTRAVDKRTPQTHML